MAIRTDLCGGLLTTPELSRLLASVRDEFGARASQVLRMPIHVHRILVAQVGGKPSVMPHAFLLMLPYPTLLRMDQAVSDDTIYVGEDPDNPQGEVCRFDTAISSYWEEE